MSEQKKAVAIQTLTVRREVYEDGTYVQSWQNNFPEAELIGICKVLAKIHTDGLAEAWQPKPEAE
jgi:hypothetical protein